jgi:hypothetical protein
MFTINFVNSTAAFRLQPHTTLTNLCLLLLALSHHASVNDSNHYKISNGTQGQGWVSVFSVYQQLRLLSTGRVWCDFEAISRVCVCVVLSYCTHDTTYARLLTLHKAQYRWTAEISQRLNMMWSLSWILFLSTESCWFRRKNSNNCNINMIINNNPHHHHHRRYQSN